VSTCFEIWGVTKSETETNVTARKMYNPFNKAKGGYALSDMLHFYRLLIALP